MTRACRAFLTTFAERSCKVDAAGAKGGRESEENAGEQGDDKSEGEYAWIDACFLKARQAGRSKGLHQRNTSGSNGSGAHATGQGQ
jgi:hypothetical protein